MNRNRTKGITGINRGNRDEIFTAAYDGSYYTIIGCGGDLGEWATGYTQILEEAGIGTPKRFIAFKGADMNVHYGLTGDNAYQDDLPCLMFPLDGLDAGKLAVIKLKMHDRWFDDIVDSNRRRQEAING